MNHFKMRLILTGFVFLCVITTLEAGQNPLHEQNPLTDLIDNNLKGFFLSGGVGYGMSRVEYQDLEIDSESFSQTLWKVGYATTDHFGVFVTSILTDFAPKFGVMWYPIQESRPSNQRYYMQASLGISSYQPRADITSLGISSYASGVDVVSVGGGLGYEFRPHFVFDAAVGYSRLQSRVYVRERGGTLESPRLYVDRAISLVLSVNYLFY